MKTERDIVEIAKLERDYQMFKAEFDRLEREQPDNMLALSMVGHDAFRTRVKLQTMLGLKPMFSEEVSWRAFFNTHIRGLQEVVHESESTSAARSLAIAKA